MASTHLGEPIASELTRVVRAIVASVQPDGVILFGSRARGDFRADFDFDLAILVPDGIPRRRVAMRAYESLANMSDRSVAVDIVVLTRSIIATERDLTGSIARAVSREGAILCGSPAALA
jgi:predicted nucleotidyltransferase